MRGVLATLLKTIFSVLIEMLISLSIPFQFFSDRRAMPLQLPDGEPHRVEFERVFQRLRHQEIHSSLFEFVFWNPAVPKILTTSIFLRAIFLQPLVR